MDGKRNPSFLSFHVEVLNYSLTVLCSTFSVAIQIKQKKLKEQKAQFEAQYTQTTTNLEHEIATHCNLEAMVNVKNAGDEGSDREKGEPLLDEKDGWIDSLE